MIRRDKNIARIANRSQNLCLYLCVLVGHVMSSHPSDQLSGRSYVSVSAVLWIHLNQKWLTESLSWTAKNSVNPVANKTQCQLCKRLTWPIIPHFWSGKGYHLWMWSLRGSQQPFSCALGHFRHGDNQTNNQTTGWSSSKPALDQWEGSLL